MTESQILERIGRAIVWPLTVGELADLQHVSQGLQRIEARALAARTPAELADVKAARAHAYIFADDTLARLAERHGGQN